VADVERDVSPAARAARTLGSLLERRSSRRGLLARAAVAGSAFAVAPVRYLIRPGTAWAVLTPDGCPPGSRCQDGYTAFCCELEHGNNRCPDGTYVAGWWKCTDYRGSGLCSDQGYRYYLDCNRSPGTQFPGGCQCANENCNERRVDCNHFRYGQCNTQVQGETEVVCRLVICQHPGAVPGLNCNSTEMIDDNTCSHEAGCLKGLAIPVHGGGGA
jgi:hypothetical protein